MKNNFEEEVLNVINSYGSDQPLLVVIMKAIVSTLEKHDNKITPEIIMGTIESILDIVIPKLDLPPPQFITRKIAKKTILKAIKPIIYGE